MTSSRFDLGLTLKTLNLFYGLMNGSGLKTLGKTSIQQLNTAIVYSKKKKLQ